MSKRNLNSPAAPAPVGPYSHAVHHGGLLFLSGQIGLDPASGQLVGGGVAAEAGQALKNALAVLDAAGAGAADVLKATVFLRDMADFQAVNEVYARFFAAPYPARSAVAVAGLPRGAAVEIELIARDPAGS